MKKVLQSFLLLIVLLNVLSAADSTGVPEYLSSISVIVTTSGGSGSGVAITRKDAKGQDITFIWTAGHIFQHREIIPFFFIIRPGSTNPSPEPKFNTSYYTNAIISQDVTINGEYAYTTNLSATVIKCSPDKTGNDLAVLRVNGKFFNTNTVAFDLSGRIPKLGELLYGVNSPYEEWGMFTTGVFSFIGRNIDGLLYDQTTLVVYPGSSGGGVFSPEGKCVGLTLIMRASNMNYIVPIRRMQKWAKQENIEWMLNPSIPMPSEKLVKSIKRNDQCPVDKTFKPTLKQLE